MKVFSHPLVTRRNLLGSAGVGLVIFGVGLAFYPDFVTFGFDAFLVVLIGVGTLFGALRIGLRYRHTTVAETRTPDPEMAISTPSPGEDLEAVLAQFTEFDGIYFHRDRLRSALRSTAITVLTRLDVYSEAEARTAVDEGSWTDDPYAAAFLGDGVDVPPLRNRLRDIVTRTPTTLQNLHRTVDAIAELAGIDVPSSDDKGPVTAAGIWRRREPSVSRQPSIEESDTSDEFPRTQLTHHWRDVSIVAFVGIAIGILAQQPPVLLAGVIGIGFAAYARSRVLPPGEIAISRTLDDDSPAPGETVEITLTITNQSGRYLPDVRVIDGVPTALAVDDGSPRIGTALRSTEEVTFSYSVTARRGVHSFEPTFVLTRDLPASVEDVRLTTVDTSLTCVPRLEPLRVAVPLKEQASQYVGSVETSRGGSGLEFHSIRQYHPGDTPSRVDWRRLARTGELTTLEFREERAANVVLVIDSRSTAYASPEPNSLHAVDRSVDAARSIAPTLLQDGNRVGLAAVNSETCWLAPNAGANHRTRLRELLGTHQALSSVPHDTDVDIRNWVRQFRTRLSHGTQIILLTPLCDDTIGWLATQLEAYGYPVTVISPDPTTDTDPGTRLARVARTVQLATLRRAGIPVIDWSAHEPIDIALARYEAGWSA